ncbi:mite group 2 allergen-like Ixo r 2 [Amblyomma americanum]
MEPCDSDPCVLRKGKTSRVHFSIISDQDTKTAWLSGKFKLWIIPVKIPGLSQDMCKNIVQCPIAKGERYGGSMRVTIPSYAPSMKTNVELKISGDKGSSVCIKADVLIR